MKKVRNNLLLVGLLVLGSVSMAALADVPCVSSPKIPYGWTGAGVWLCPAGQATITGVPSGHHGSNTMIFLQNSSGSGSIQLSGNTSEVTFFSKNGTQTPIVSFNVTKDGSPQYYTYSTGGSPGQQLIITNTGDTVVAVAPQGSSLPLTPNCANSNSWISDSSGAYSCNDGSSYGPFLCKFSQSDNEVMVFDNQNNGFGCGGSQPSSDFCAQCRAKEMG